MKIIISIIVGIATPYLACFVDSKIEKIDLEDWISFPTKIIAWFMIFFMGIFIIFCINQ